MKKSLLFTLVTLVTNCTAFLSASANPTIANNATAARQGTPLSFIENKGQVVDQYGKHRKDIDYKLIVPGMTMFVGDGALHYQWSRSPHPAYPQGGSDGINRNNNNINNSITSPLGGGQEGATQFYRMDVELVGADKNAAVVAEGEQAYVENYYLAQCPDGATAHSYSRVTYKNVYPNIDWVIYISPHPASPQGGSDGINHNNINHNYISSPLGGGQEGASLKYDFVVHPGGDPSQIKLQYNGATSLQLQDGALIATTPFGSITENAPYSYYAATKEQITSSFKLTNNILSYNISSPWGRPGEAPLIIDPSLNWSTYYGGSDDELNNAIATDTAAAAYLCGSTRSTANIATSGAFQTSLGTVTTTGWDGFAVKFDSSGVRQWATYYGKGGESFMSVATDTFGNVFFSGRADSSGMATAGAYQASPTAGIASILTKFNAANGSRIWATYYNVANSGNVITCDWAGNVYIGVEATTTSGLATAGAYQTTIGSSDAMLLTKFSGSGSRLWATYHYMSGYGRQGCFLTVDGANNVYMAGEAYINGLATAGAHKTSYTSLSAAEGLIVKFSPTGTRLWASYYGGPNTRVYGISCDANDNLYAVGATNSSTGIATAGCHQSTLPGINGCAFLAKFNSAGVRQWGTYYGGILDVLYSVSCDKKGNVYCSGDAQAGSSLTTTAGAYQTSSAGSFDAIMTVFNTDGVRRYGTYFGGTGAETVNGYNASSVGQHMAVSKDRAYFCGITNSSSGIATANAHQTSFAGYTNTVITAGLGDVFLTQFGLDTQVYIKQPFTDTARCGLDTMHIPYGVIKRFRSSNTFTFQLSDGSGSFASPTGMGSASGSQGDSIFKWVVPHNITAGTGYRVRILASAPRDTAYEDANIKLRPAPLVTPGSNSPVCSGTTLSFTATTAYSGVSFSWSGPAGFNAAIQNPGINNALTTHSGKYIVTATLNGCSAKDSITNVVVNQSPATPTATSNSPICEGADLNFTANNTVPGVSYSWSGPGSFTSPLQNPTIASATTAATGAYTVTAKLGTCTAGNTISVTVNVGPKVLIYPNPGDSICAGKKLTLVALLNPVTGGTGYQWQKDGLDIQGATGATYSPAVVADGEVYSLKMIPAASYGCTTPINSNSVAMTVLQYQSPFVTITASDTNAWPGVLINFQATAGNAGNDPKYQWKLNGKNVVGATSNVWGATTLSNNDSVCVEVTSSYLCPSPVTATACKKVKVATGIHDVANSKLHIYPNPASTQVTIEGLSTGTTIQLNDVYGRTVYEGISTQSSTTINTQNLVPGNYILQLTDSNGMRSSYKLVKE